jgi:uncharacterized protein
MHLIDAKKKVMNKLIRFVLMVLLANVLSLAAKGSTSQAAASVSVDKYVRFFGNYRLEKGGLLSIGRDEQRMFLMNYASRQLSYPEEIADKKFRLPDTEPNVTLVLIETGRDGVAGLELRSANGNGLRASRLSHSSEDVHFQNGKISLEGTLWLPPGGGKHPAIVLVHGSGEETRYGMRQYPYFFMSLGFAVLTYDKRGCGHSTGDYLPWLAGIRALAGDVLAGVEMLRKHAAIHADRIGLMGISNGAWVIENAAARMPEIAFIIPNVGGGVPPWQQEIYRITTLARRSGYTEAEITDLSDSLRRLYSDHFFNPPDKEKALKEFEALLDGLKKKKWFKLTPASQFANVPNAQLFELGRGAWNNELSYDPIPDLRLVHRPVLFLLGELDDDTPTQATIAAIKGELGRGGTADVTIRVLPKAGHFLVEENNAPGTAKTVFAKGLFETLRSWLSSKVQGG